MTNIQPLKKRHFHDSLKDEVIIFHINNDDDVSITLYGHTRVISHLLLMSQLSALSITLIPTWINEL